MSDRLASPRAFRSRRAVFLAGVAVLLGAVISAADGRPASDERRAEVSEDRTADSPDDPPVFQISDREPWNSLSVTGQEPLPTSEASAAEPISVLVHLDPRTDRLQRPGIKAFAAARGAFTMYEYDILPNVINIRRFPRGAVEALRSLPGVVQVEEDYEVTMHHNDSVPLIRAYQTQLQAAGFTVNGSGVRVCVLDTGIDSNSLMYSTRIDAGAGWDFVNGDSNPEDDNGHGSHVAGTVLGGLVNANFPCPSIPSESMQGVAPAAMLVGVKVLGSTGSGSASNIVAGINRCASASLPGGRTHVINLSLGAGQFTSACDSDLIASAANAAVAAGLVVVVAGGNNNYANALSSPACASQVIAVGAIYDDTFPNCDFPSQTSFSFCTNSSCTTTCTDNSPVVNQRACFSNRSPMLDVVAPGCVTFSDDSTVSTGDGLVGFCGTSQAAPHVSGLAALLLDLDPTLTPAEVRQVIQDGAVDLGAAGFDSSFGHGRVDAINALALAAPPGCTTNEQCSDGLFCNGAEVCVTGTCQAGSPPSCGDGVGCTADACNEDTDSCDHAPSDAACDDGLFCNGAETCDLVDDCEAGTAPSCGDAVGCTADACNEGTDSCDHAPSDAACDDVNACTVDVCDPVTDCKITPVPDTDGDGDCDTADTCPLTPNGGGGVAMFPEPIVAHDALAFSFTLPSDIVWARGDLGLVGGYSVIETQISSAATSFPSGPTPEPDGGFYFLVKANCPLTTWSSGGAGECAPPDVCPPGGRDGNLP